MSRGRATIVAVEKQ